MSEWRNRLRLIVTVVLAGFVVATVVTAQPPQVDRAQAIGEQIRCPVCQGESIADSPSGLARDMMVLVRERVAEGYSDEQIISELLVSYTQAQRLKPPVTPSTIALWLIPALALLAGGWLLLRKRRNGSSSPGATTP